MDYEFYLDVFFLEEFFRNLLALILAGAMGQKKLRPFRLCFAAAFGSFWSFFMLFLGLPAAVKLPVTAVAAAGAMNGIAFSVKKPAEMLRADGLLLAASVFLGGGLLFFRQFAGLSAWEAFFCAAAACGGLFLFFCNVSRKKAIGRERYTVRLYYRGKRKDFLALADSGNRLREPASRKPVSVISYEDCIDFCDRLSSVIYIPYRAVGTGCGVLPGIIFEEMEILAGSECLRIEKPIVAVTREPLSGNGDFNMLLPEELLFMRSMTTL